MTKQLKLSALAAALLVSATAFAAKPGYVADQSTDAVTRLARSLYTQRALAAEAVQAGVDSTPEGAAYLRLMGLEPPPLFGLHVERLPR